MAYDKDFPDSSDLGEDRNLEGSKDKGDNNSNFLKDNSFLYSGNGCSEMHSVSEKPSQQNLGENYSHSSFTGTSNEGNDKNGDERKLEIDSKKGDLMNGKKEIDVCIETNEDGLSSAEDNVLAEIVMNEDAMQIKYEEKLDNFKKELGEKDMEESEVKRMKIGVEVSNIKIDVEKENGEEIVENLFEENVRIEEVKEVETDKVDRKEVRKIEIKCVEENEVKEGYLDKIMEIKGSGEEKAKEDYIEKDKDTKKMDQKDEELEKVEEKDEIKKDEYTKEKKLKNESNNKLYILDENEHEELLLIGNKEDEDLDETDSIDEEELLQECANMKVQKYDKELEEVDEHFKSNGKLMKDEKNPKKVIDDQLAAFFGHKTLKDGLLQTRSSLGTSTPNIKDGSLYKRVAVAGTGTPNFEDGALFKRAVSSTPNTKQDKNWSSTPISKPLLQNTPFSKSGSFCTPAQTVLKCWKPAALRRSKLFTSNTELNKSALEANTPGKFSTIQEENEDDGDDFDTSLMKLEQKLAEIENEKKLPSSDLGKSFSKIEAYHKTIVAEREEDSQKLEEVIMELSSQLFSDVQKGLVQGSQDELSVIEEGNEDEDSDLVMLEFLEGGNDGLKVVEDVDFANEQNDTVIEIDDEESLLEETQKLMIKSGVKENETLEKVMKQSSDVEFSTPDSDAEVSIQDSDVDFTTPDSDLEIISIYESPSTSDVLSGTTSSNAIISGSLSSDVSCSSMSIDSVKLVSGTESDIKPRTTFSGVMLETTSSLDVDTSEIPEPESTSRLDVVKSKVPVPESSTSADVVPASTSGLDVVESTTGSDVVESTTLSTPSDAELPTDVTAKASSSKPAQESEPNADCPTPKEPSGVSDHEERNKPFYSDDPLENLDNFNPKWEIWKNLTNDRDRYREISKRWRNMSIPNPNENLSFLKCLDDAKKRALNQVPEPMNDFNGNMNVNTGQNKKKKKNKKKRKFQEAFDPNNQIEEGPPTKRQRCTVATEIFDIEIHKLLRTLEGKRYALQSEMNAELNCLAARQERQIYDCIFNYNANHHELHFLQIKEVEQLTNFFQQKLLEAEEETSRVVTMLRMSIDEVRTFHAFYEDLQDDNGESQFITVNQLDELLETEFMVSSYQQRYGEFQ